MRRGQAEAVALIVIAMMFLALFAVYGRIAMAFRDRAKEVAFYGQVISMKTAEKIYVYMEQNDLCIVSTIPTRVAMVVVFTPGQAEIYREQVQGAELKPDSCTYLSPLLGIGTFKNEKASILIMTERGNAFYWSPTMGPAAEKVV